MVKRNTFLHLDDLLAGVVQREFDALTVTPETTSELHPATRRILERRAEAELANWVSQHGQREGERHRIVLSDEEGLPVMEFVVDGWGVKIDAENSSVKVVWERPR